MSPECGYDCQKEDEIKAQKDFREKALAKLSAIEALMKERKENSTQDEKDLWEAIKELRNDIKALYWKVGMVSGGTSLIVSLVIWLVTKGGAQ